MNKALKSCAPEERESEFHGLGQGYFCQPPPTCVILSKALHTLSLSFLISNNQELA